MKKTIFILSLMFLGTAVYGQYNFAIGLRSGGTSGITLKKNNPATSIEGIIGFWNDGLSLTGLYEKHPAVEGVSGLHWIYGFGGHIVFYGNDFRGKAGPAWYNHDRVIADDDLGLGIDGIVGIEYKIPPIPVAISLDLKPFMELTTNGAVWFSFDPGLGLKFVF